MRVSFELSINCRWKLLFKCNTVPRWTGGDITSTTVDESESSLLATERHLSVKCIVCLNMKKKENEDKKQKKAGRKSAPTLRHMVCWAEIRLSTVSKFTLFNFNSIQKVLVHSNILSRHFTYTNSINNNNNKKEKQSLTNPKLWAEQNIP